jgi:hypothetical protein
MNYAYHMDAGRYAKFLRRLSEPHGVQRIEGKIAEVHTKNLVSGDIIALRLDSGAEIEGDLFIDCTGFRALLIGETMGVDYEDWSHWLFCDSASPCRQIGGRRRALHPLDRPRCRLAVAHPAAAPRRQRHRVLEPPHGRRKRCARCRRPTSTAKC